MASVFQIPVKMGSRKLVVEIESSSKITCSQFVETVLKKCKLSSNEKLTKSYSLFESVSGIEKLLKNNDNLANIWKYWLNESKQQNVEFIVRKCLSIEKKLNTSIKTTTITDEKHKQMIKNYYKKINSESKKQQVQQQSSESLRQEYIIKTIQNEQELKKQSEQLVQIQSLIKKLENAENLEQVHEIKSQSNKLCSYHQASVANNLNEKISVNINFLQFLYFKLKKQNNNNSYKKLIDTSCLNNSFGEDNYDSNRSSRNSSTSTLESLV